MNFKGLFFIFIPIVMLFVGCSNTPIDASSPGPAFQYDGGGFVINGSFEDYYSSWSRYGNPYISTDRHHSGSKSAWLAGYPNADDEISQALTIPAHAILTYYWLMSSADSANSPYDYFLVAIGTINGTNYAVRQRDNTAARGSWYKDTIDLSAFAGQTLRIWFIGMNDGSLDTSFYVDDISITGDGIPAKTGTGSFKTLNNGSTTSISDLNGMNVYTIVTAQPASKPEGNQDITPGTYPFNLLTTSALANIVAPCVVTADVKNKGNANSSVKVKDITFNSRQQDQEPSKKLIQQINSTAVLYTTTEAASSALNKPYKKGQTDFDSILRQTENQLLAGKATQLSKNTGRAAPVSISVGTPWANVMIATTGKTISTTCRYISAYAYIFVDDRDTAAMSPYLAGYGAAFDTIYTNDRAKFGTNNDVDHNGKVIIIFSRELTDGLLGYFYSVDKYSRSTYANSNEGDIFYLTTDAYAQGNILKGTLAHEFQHMIYFDEHYNRGVTATFTWLNEALSQAAEYYNGYLDNHLAWINDYLNSNWNGLSLTYWTSSNYGYGAVFIRYLIDRFGDAAIKNMCSTDKVGIAAVEAAVSEDFNTLFNEFSQAMVLSGTGITADSRYNFTTLDLKAVQPNGRGGLVTSLNYTAGMTFYSSSGIYPYMLLFTKWTGNFDSMNLTGTGIAGTAFNLNQ